MRSYYFLGLLFAAVLILDLPQAAAATPIPRDVEEEKEEPTKKTSCPLTSTGEDEAPVSETDDTVIEVKEEISQEAEEIKESLQEQHLEEERIQQEAAHP